MELKQAAVIAFASLSTIFAASCNKTPVTATKVPTTERAITSWSDSTFVGTTDKIAGPPWRGDGAVLTYRNPQ